MQSEARITKMKPCSDLRKLLYTPCGLRYLGGKCPELERKPGNQETCEFMQIMDLSENHGMSLIVFRCLRTSARRTCVFIQLCESFASFFESGNTASWRLQIITNRCSVLGYGCILAEAWRTHERNTGWKLDSDSCDSDISFSLSMWQN